MRSEASKPECGQRDAGDDLGHGVARARVHRLGHGLGHGLPRLQRPSIHTVIYGKGTDADACAGMDLNGVAVTETKVLFASVKGIEETGDGSGNLITDLYKQYAPLADQLGDSDLLTGGWLQMTTGPLHLAATGQSQRGLVPDQCPVLARCQHDRASSGAGGYEGVAYMGFDETKSVRDWVADWNLSCDGRLGLNEFSQWTLTLLPDNVDAQTLEAFSDVVDIHESSVNIEWTRAGSSATSASSVGDCQAGARGRRARLGAAFPKQPGNTNLLAKERAGRLGRDGPDLCRCDRPGQLCRRRPWLSGPVPALHPVCGRDRGAECGRRGRGAALAGAPGRAGDPRDLPHGPVRPAGGPGDVVRVSHFAGVSDAGWVDRLVQVERLVVDAGQGTVTITGRDVSQFVQASIRTVAAATIRFVGLAPALAHQAHHHRRRPRTVVFGPLAPTVTKG